MSGQVDGDVATRRGFVLEEQNCGYGEQGKGGSGSSSAPPGGGEAVAPEMGGSGLGGEAVGDAGFEAFGRSGGVEGGEGFVDRVVGLVFGVHKCSKEFCVSGKSAKNVSQGLKPKLILPL